MKKKILLAFIVITLGILLFGAVSVYAVETYGNYKYTVSNGKATIVDFDTTVSGEITIPSEINDYPVTAIGYRAFYECRNLTGITIPDSVTSIGGAAFYLCNSLTSINIPDSVTSIGSSAFTYCYDLTSISIPHGTTDLGYATFAYCTSLKSVLIPNSVTFIDGWAFKNCGSLETVYFGGTEKQWNEITIGADNTPLEEAKMVYLNQMRTKTSVSEDKKTLTVTNIKENSKNIVVLAFYNGKQVVDIQYLPCTAAEIPFTTDRSYDLVKVTIWESLTNIRPIYAVETVK